MKIRLFTIPNFLTLANLVCGIFSSILLSIAFGGNLHVKVETGAVLNLVLLLMVLSLFFDFLDGMAARALKINSEIGIQLDSLADMVSFGLVPGLMMLNLLDNSLEPEYRNYSYLALLITLFSALRLAKFNVDTEQSAYFKGLATPSNTIFIAGLLWIQTQNGYLISADGIADSLLLLIITGLFSWLLIANIPMFSFKLKGFGWQENYYKYLFLIISILLLILFQAQALAFIIPIYIIISIIFRKKIIHA